MNRSEHARLVMEMMKEVIDRDVEIPLKTFGVSMRPYLQGGEWIVVRRTAPEGIRIGDIVLYQAGQFFVAHRVIGRRREGGRIFFRMKGDGHLAAEGEIPGNAVVARVVALHKRNARVNLDCLRNRVLSRLMALWSSSIDRLYRCLRPLRPSTQAKAA